MVTGRLSFFLLLLDHLCLLHIIGILINSNLEAELDRLLRDKSSASEYLAARSIMLRNIGRKESRCIIDVLVRVLLVDLISLDFRVIFLAAQCTNAACLRNTTSFT